MPKPLSSHALVSIGGDIIVIGGVDSNYDDQSSLYKLSCNNGDCKWTTLDQKLQKPRSDMVAMVVPDDFFDCQ